MITGLGLDQLGCDADPISRSSHASFDHITYAKVTPHCLDIRRVALVVEGGVPRDHEQGIEPSKFSDDVFGDAISEVLLLWVARNVDEGQMLDR